MGTLHSPTNTTLIVAIRACWRSFQGKGVIGGVPPPTQMSPQSAHRASGDDAWPQGFV